MCVYVCLSGGKGWCALQGNAFLFESIDDYANISVLYGNYVASLNIAHTHLPHLV